MHIVHSYLYLYVLYVYVAKLFSSILNLQQICLCHNTHALAATMSKEGKELRQSPTFLTPLHRHVMYSLRYMYEQPQCKFGYYMSIQNLKYCTL